LPAFGRQSILLVTDQGPFCLQHLHRVFLADLNRTLSIPNPAGGGSAGICDWESAIRIGDTAHIPLLSLSYSKCEDCLLFPGRLKGHGMEQVEHSRKGKRLTGDESMVLERMSRGAASRVPLL
jgi:hypothetical protein